MLQSRNAYSRTYLNIGYKHFKYFVEQMLCACLYYSIQYFIPRVYILSGIKLFGWLISLFLKRSI